MAECYLCGCHIERGEGFRRNVQTGTSTRVYFSRRSGSSYGVNYGTRTVCWTCAAIMDRMAEGAWLRGLIYTGASVLSVWTGWNMLVNGDGSGLARASGIVCLLCIPVLALHYIVDEVRKNLVAKRLHADVQVAEHKAEFAAWSIRHPNEPVSEWLDRITPYYPGRLDREEWEQVARVHPPRIGETSESWIRSWPDWGTIWDCRNDD